MFKRNLHEAAFELIEIPHVRQSGKNSADIRMVVDALDLCYTKSHVDTFVIISGDSDFSPLVSKLRENNKTVIGMGVKKSTSDLFINNCDEFLYYDDLVRAGAGEKAAQPAAFSRAPPTTARRPRRGAESDGPSPDRALELVSHTMDALRAERGEDYEIRGSLIKQTIKRRILASMNGPTAFAPSTMCCWKRRNGACSSSTRTSRPARTSCAPSTSDGARCKGRDD